MQQTTQPTSATPTGADLLGPGPITAIFPDGVLGNECLVALPTAGLIAWAIRCRTAIQPCLLAEWTGSGPGLGEAARAAAEAAMAAMAGPAADTAGTDKPHDMTPETRATDDDQPNIAPEMAPSAPVIAAQGAKRALGRNRGQGADSHRAAR